MGGWDEELFYSRFQAAVLRAERGEWAAAMAGLVAAWESRPQRLEPLYELAARLRMRGAGNTIRLVNNNGSIETDSADTAITIVRIA
jgi:hypothetical protein